MRCTSWSLCTLYLLTCQVTENAASTTSHQMGKEKFLSQLWQLCCPWANIGNECLSRDLWSTHVEDTGQWGSCEGTYGSVPEKSSQWPTLQWYAPHWSVPWLSGVPTSTRTSNYLEKDNDEQSGTWPATTQTDLCWKIWTGHVLNNKDDRLGWRCSTKSAMTL